MSQRLPLGPDGRVVAVAGVHDRLVRQREELRADRVLDEVGVAERPPGGPRAALEEGVAGEDAAEVVHVDAHRAGRVPRRVQDLERGARDLDGLAVGDVDVPQLVGVGQLPQRPVVGVQQDRRADPLPQPGRDAAVVVVGVGQQDRLDLAPAHHVEDRVDVVGGVDDHALLVVADDPDVVVDLVHLPVEGEGAGHDGVVHPQAAHQKTTTERSTAPPCILSKAASTSSIEISSVTKASRSSRPCW